jgi:hypothetical protein
MEKFDAEGETQVSLLEEMKVAGTRTPPKAHCSDLSLTNPNPVITTALPPSTGPEKGVIDSSAEWGCTCKVVLKREYRHDAEEQS